MEKQKAGFKFGKHRLEVLEQIGQVQQNGRSYRLVKVRTEAGEEYLSLRLYNERGKFIKQFLTEPHLAHSISVLYQMAVWRAGK